MNNKIYDSKIYKLLYSTELDKLLLPLLKDKKVKYYKNEIILPRNISNSDFSEKNILLRIKNYIECNIINPIDKDIHLIDLILSFEENNNAIELTLTETGNMIL